MKRIITFLLILVVTSMLYATGGGQQQGTTQGTAQRVVTQVTPRPLSVSPQWDMGDNVWHAQPATSYSTSPRYPRQPAVSNTNGFPIVQQPITMSVATRYSPYVIDYDDNDLSRFMETLTNVRIVWDLLPEGNSMERLNLMFAAGDALPDVIYGMNLPNSMQITLGSAGLLIPLQDLIEEHSYNAKILFEEHPAVYSSMFSADGNAYSMSSFGNNTANRVAMRFWINQPFLDAVGMSMPRTTEDYYRYLIAVRDRDPNGNGLRDEIPLIGATNGWYQTIDGFLMNAFIINETIDHREPLHNRRRMFLTEDGIVDVAYNKPEWREGLEYMHRLHSEQLMATESFTLTNAELRALVEFEGASIVGSLPAGGPHSFSNTAGDRRTHYTIVPPLIGPRGVQWAYYNQFLGIGVGQFAITRDSLIPEVAIKWMDYCYTPDFFTRNRYGVLGRDWTIPPPGTPAVDGRDASYEEVLRWGAQTNAYWAQSGVTWTRIESYNRAISPDPFELEAVLWNARNVYWPYRFTRNVPKELAFTPDEARDFTNLNTNLVQYIEQQMAQFVTGRLPLNDSNWNAYVQQIDRLGLAQLLQITQRAFDRSWAEALGYR